MPYMIKKTGDKWCTHKKDADGQPDGATLGCHPTEDAAKKQQSALYAKEPGSKFVENDPKKAFKKITAAAIPVAPPAAWFQDPGFDSRTRLTVTDDGQVYGHLAPWSECHVGIQGACITAPHSATDYGFFALGTVRCEDGCDIPIGSITMDTGHADKSLRARSAAAHYDNTGTAIADIAVGEDDHGIWIAGALRPTVTPEQIRALRASRLSGDWRAINGHLELVAALAVNVGGFPVHEEYLAADGSVRTLVASLSEDIAVEYRDTALRAAVAPLLRPLADTIRGRVHTR